MVYKIELFDKKYNYDCFCSEEESLNSYIKNYAGQDIAKQVARVYVLFDDPSFDVLGFYTLCSYSVEIFYFDEVYPKRKLPRYSQIPTILLGRLAVSQDQTGKGLGGVLLMDALKRCFDYSQGIGSMAVVVDAINQKSAEFYLHYGFVETKDNPLKLFYPMVKIQKLFP